MKLLEIRLENFRQFYGRQVIKISADDKKNVTLIHGENGYGKTTLLNALLWCFYEQTTPKFEGKSRLVNFEAEEAGNDTATVEVLFDHEGTRYLAQRRAKRRGRRPPLKIFLIKDGNYKDLQLTNPETFVDSVIPSSMAKYFFFDGEQAEAFAGEKNNQEVGAAIQTMLGCNVAQSAIDDLEYLARKFDEEIGKLPDKEEISQKERSLSGLREAKDELVKRHGTIVEKRIANGQVLESLVDDLVAIREAAELGRQRTTLGSKLALALERQEKLSRRRMRWLGERAVMIVGVRLADTVLATLNRNDLSAIPSPYNEEFVNNLLAKGECICGRIINEGTKEYGCVASLLSNAPSSVVQRKAIGAKVAAGQVHARRKTDWPMLRDLDQDRAENANEVGDLEQTIGEISRRLAEHGVRDVREKEKSIELAKFEERKLSEELGELKLRMADVDVQIASAKSEIDRLVAEDSTAKPLVARRQLCDRAIGGLQSALEEYKDEARQIITNEVNKVLDGTAHKDFVARIGEDFSLTLGFRDGVESPKSGGENQLLSLAFIAALVRFSHDRRSDKRDQLLIPGTVAPLMLDSPFGQLDAQYSAAVSSFVPSMATQVLLLVSSKQGSKEVVAGLSDRIGKEYELVWMGRDKHRSLIKEIV